ncbi:MAG: hypothetical protein BWY17_01065 [Deltaproteobacteria bacterium ADurb.Bin207]|jgi:hypothetical protein|nr:MAG: hypothetical protein BWY17_01065 [Deltaproteobacteria bacterium ADurb.Bin207]
MTELVQTKCRIFLRRRNLSPFSALLARCFGSLLLSGLLVLHPIPLVAAPRVLVRGASRLEAVASGPQDRIQIHGTLRDEVGEPIADALLLASAMAEPGVTIAWRTVGACTDESTSRSDSTDVPVTTDASGAFCFVGSLARRQAMVRVVFAGSAHFNETQTIAAWNASQQSLSIAFTPRPEKLDLDADRILVFARVTPATTTSVRGLPIALKTEDGSTLATEKTDDSGLVHFDVASAAMAPPGIGALTIAFAGSDHFTPAQATTSVTRSVRVALNTDTQIIRGDPSRGLALQVHALSSRGPVPSGTIEANLNGQVIGTGTVMNGAADVSLTFSPSHGETRYSVDLHYRPDSPFYEPARATPVQVMAEAPSPWIRFIPVAAAIIVTAWLARGWRRPPRREMRASRTPIWKGIASVDVVSASSVRNQWTGRVVDAHDGLPLFGARVRVIAPTFVDEDVVMEVYADDSGHFEFRLPSVEPALRLYVETATHARVDQPLPPASEMVIALASRRRLLIDRLVHWARDRGKPWYREPEPTPGQIAKVARAHHGNEVAVWAEQVERRAFGSDLVDQRIEKEVHDLEPRGHALR